MSQADPTMERLEDQINWYDRRSGANQQMYKGIKLAQIVLAAAIPVFAGIARDVTILLGALGALVVILEGVQQLYQFQQAWVTYRSTSEALKHEKFLYLGKAGPYAAVDDPHGVLAERVESLISEEHAKWIGAARGRKSGKG
ncbi:MAG: DUF4231 domain-containing protein [Armatimonadota bacterium]|nr:MAG: DUF4231 domain-containing protein [Armatimonadota bacterium]